MSVFVNPLKSEKAKFREETSQRIQNHKRAIYYLEAAIRNHTEAAKHYEEGNHELAVLSNVEAHNNIEMATQRYKTT
ncbi:MAG: hypothetical protein V4677_14830 [Bacteroidota bacterium]